MAEAEITNAKSAYHIAMTVLIVSTNRRSERSASQATYHR